MTTQITCTYSNPKIWELERGVARKFTLTHSPKEYELEKSADYAEEETWDLLTGLISYWNFDGATAEDSYGDNDLDISAATTGETGKISDCFYFDGQWGTYVGDLTNKIASLEIDSPISISAWFKADVSMSAASSIVSDSYSVFDGYNLYLNSSQKIVWQVGGGGDYKQKTSDDAYNTGEWVHVVATYDGAELILYINGTKEGDSAAWEGTIEYDDIARFFIGANASSYDDPPVEAVDNWLGYIDEVGIWSVALGQDEVTALYNSGSGRTYPFE